MGGAVGGGMQQPGIPQNQMWRPQQQMNPAQMTPEQIQSLTGVDPSQQKRMPPQQMQSGMPQGMPPGMGGGFGGPMGGMNMGGFGGGYPQQGMGGMLGGIQGGCPPWMPGCGGGGGYGGGWSGAAPMFGNTRGQLQPPAPVQQPAPAPSGGGTTIGYSDAQLKQDIEPMEDGLDVVSRIEPVRFKWIEGEQEPAAGMIAQQVQEVLPEAVIDMGDGYKGIDSLAVIGALVGAVKTLTARLEALEAK